VLPESIVIGISLRKILSRVACGSFILLLLMLSALPAVAKDKPEWRSWPNGERFTVGIGLYRPNLDTVVSVGTLSGPDTGTRVSFENNLGLEDTKSVPMIALDWRLSKRNMLRLRYFELDRSGADSSSVDIKWGDEEFEANLPVESFFDVRAIEIAYAFSVLADSRKSLAFGIGLSIQELSFGLRGTSELGDPPPVVLPDPLPELTEKIEFTAPLPTFDIKFTYAFTDKWLLEAGAGWLQLGLDLGDGEELDGHILNGTAALRYKAFENVGFRLAYLAFDIDVDYQKRNLLALVDYTYHGPVLGVEAFF
jgi:hypothetical protein